MKLSPIFMKRYGEAMYNDVIAAISTPIGTGGIAVVRISGDMAFSVADCVFSSKKYSSVSDMDGYTLAFGRVYDFAGDIDEAVVAVFKAPHSYTGENVVEVSIHGGVYLANRLLRAFLSAGARIAEPGEFTRRAFLSGKLDLTQAESVMDLIGAQNGQAAKAALAAHDGALFQEISVAADRVAAVAAEIGAWIDYPEEDMDVLDSKRIGYDLLQSREMLRKLLDTYDKGRIIRDGVETVIIGKPNTGKSTLMNLLSGYQRSIVTDIAGTTRDIITENIQIGNYVLHISDTAGIHDTSDIVEKTGVAAALEKLGYAQLVIAVFDGSAEFSTQDQAIVEYTSGKPVLALINKNDLPVKIDTKKLEQSFDHLLYISANDPSSKEQIECMLEEIFGLDALDAGAAMLANERQRQGVQKAYTEIGDAVSALENGVSYDAVSVCIETALDALLTLTGKRASDSIVAEIFSRFCVGK